MWIDDYDQAKRGLGSTLYQAVSVARLRDSHLSSDEGVAVCRINFDDRAGICGDDIVLDMCSRPEPVDMDKVLLLLKTRTREQKRTKRDPDMHN